MLAKYVHSSIVDYRQPAVTSEVETEIMMGSSEWYPGVVTTTHTSTVLSSSSTVSDLFSNLIVGTAYNRILYTQINKVVLLDFQTSVKTASEPQ